MKTANKDEGVKFYIYRPTTAFPNFTRGNPTRILEIAVICRKATVRMQQNTWSLFIWNYSTSHIARTHDPSSKLLRRRSHTNAIIYNQLQITILGCLIDFYENKTTEQTRGSSKLDTLDGCYYSSLSSKLNWTAVLIGKHSQKLLAGEMHLKNLKSFIPQPQK